ncbi:hypothetical protein [Marinitenerispora sediminis]|uniref:Core-binding (CB) domain-containing protein n=1 Tax=Marinitenerispora sediminis TaxID=1931232 RepID=A0A368TBU6_9ACTN|nr:hypothetical protein [Marinitenerispora sediminis]RCV56114.1 hypothetical protein DEF23_13075 [Marinitenerispora sediminis]RCV57981.1 hypothetical protein DEF28_00775 [Marinitenerispora sediminis]RCV62582.1 hypothetical protein DEF24_00500 [Marinitenerispora sediminis]
MATINKRPLQDGSIRYWVKWRLGGHRGGAPQSEPFDSYVDAHTFRLHVEEAGHQWPENWIPREGWAPGWVPGVGLIKVGTGDGPKPVYFREYALELIASMTGIEARTKADYERDIRRHMLPTFGHLDIRDTETFTHKTVRAWVNQLQEGIPDPRVLTHPHTGKDTSKAKKKQRKSADHWLRPPLRPKSVHNLHGLLYLILQAAVEEELRPSNPAARTTLPRLDDGEGSDDMSSSPVASSNCSATAHTRTSATCWGSSS